MNLEEALKLHIQWLSQNGLIMGTLKKTDLLKHQFGMQLGGVVKLETTHLLIVDAKVYSIMDTMLTLSQIK